MIRNLRRVGMDRHYPSRIEAQRRFLFRALDSRSTCVLSCNYVRFSTRELILCNGKSEVGTDYCNSTLEMSQALLLVGHGR